MRKDFFSDYFDYIGETEAPMLYHRWCAISAVSTLLERNFSTSLGHFPVNPNMYIMLLGEPASRKSSAIRISKKIVERAGYIHFSASKTTKEKFLLDLSGVVLDDSGKEIVEFNSKLSAEELLTANLFGTSADDSKSPAQMYIAADEFNNFIGNGNIEFISLLGELWDYDGVYNNRIKNGKSVSIKDPTVSILSGNTAAGFSLAFPPETAGQGFFSRLLLIHGEPTGKKIPFPKSPEPEQVEYIRSKTLEIIAKCRGIAEFTPTAKTLLASIYNNGYPIPDVRFKAYTSRRFTHLFKLCLVMAASRIDTTINESDVISANTLLYHTETLMPKALGEFGKAKYADVTHKILEYLNGIDKPASITDIWKKVSSDLENLKTLGEIIRNLQLADKIQQVAGGYLSIKAVRDYHDSSELDFSYLTKEEREGL